jgi:N-acetylglucosamine-6-phosphate deacetylase
MTVITNGKIILENKILQGFNLYIQDGIIVKISDQKPEGDCDIIDASQNYVSPGFVDIHTHGAAGFDYCKCDEFGVAKAADSQLKHGTTTVLPTITASSRQDTLFALSNVKKCMDKKLSTANGFGVPIL